MSSPDELLADIWNKKITFFYMISLPPPVILRTPGVMSTAELASWAQIGKNSVPLLVTRFELREITGYAKNRKYSVLGVLRAILGVTLQDPEDLKSLLIPLQKVSWVSQTAGLSVSAIGASVCQKRGGLPSPIELTVTGPDQAPARGRRWIPAQIKAHLRGDPIPFLASQIPIQGPLSKRVPDTERNMFAAICGSNADVSRQHQM